MPAFECLIGILLGVSAVIFFQWLFWSFDHWRQLLHQLKQIKNDLQPAIACLSQTWETQQSQPVSEWCHQALGEMRLRLRAIR